MEQFLEFIVNHWVLSSIFVALVVWLVKIETGNSVKGMKLLTPQQAVHYINHEHGVLVDIRKEQEFKKGSIINSIFIPYSEIDKNIKKLHKYKNKPVIIICDVGQLASKAGAILKNKRFEQVFMLKGGIDAWKSENLPIIV